MAESFDPGALLGDSYPLGERTRVRLRLARFSDAFAVRRLLSRQGRERRPIDDPEVGTLVQFDPRQRCVLCAMALIDGRETLVGIGSIALSGPDPEPETIIVDRVADDGVAELLGAALIGRARALTHARAA
jgi:hypothetical protein